MRDHQRRFLRAYSSCGQVAEAARCAGINPDTQYHWLKSDAAYVRRFREAQPGVAQLIVDEATRRAFDGIRTPVRYKGQPVIVDGKPLYKHQYSDTLLIFILKTLKPELKKRKRIKISLEGWNADLEKFSRRQLDAIVAELQSRSEAERAEQGPNNDEVSEHVGARRRRRERRSQVEHLNTKQRCLLSCFGGFGQLRKAAQTAGVSRSAHYVWMKQCPEYVKRFNLAQEEAADRLMDEAYRRAMAGIRTPVMYRGKQVHNLGLPCYECRYSDRLLILLLKALRPERYGTQVMEVVCWRDWDGDLSKLSHDDRHEFIDEVKRKVAARENELQAQSPLPRAQEHNSPSPSPRQTVGGNPEDAPQSDTRLAAGERIQWVRTEPRETLETKRRKHWITNPKK